MVSPPLLQKGRYKEKGTLLEAQERRADVEKRIARAKERAYGKGRAAEMARLDEALVASSKPGYAWDPQKQEYVRIGGETQESGATSVLPSEKGMPAALPGATPDYDTKAPPPPETAEERKVRKAQEELLGKENAERLLEEQRKEEARKQTLIGLGETIASNARETGGKASSVLAALPTPGSLWFPLVILLLLFFILVTYNGHTRLMWAWLVLTGNASFNLGGQVAPAQSEDMGSGAGGIGSVAPVALTLAPQPSTPVGGSLSPSGVPMIGQPF